jgi:hypothetical protein
MSRGNRLPDPISQSLHPRAWPLVRRTQASRELLVPVRVEDARFGQLVEPLELLVGKSPRCRIEIVGQLFLRARADENRANARAACEPVQGDLRRRDPARLGDVGHRLDDVCR